ncbi:MAG TPA: hypothetical protein VLZ89_09810 [Anaerolineales bacterium]|nr:hypothetical protein [Anaerolineales bacterium]
MKLRLLSLLAVLLFAGGVLLQLALSGGMVWADVEAGVYGTQVAGGSLNLSCPLMLSSSEPGLITAVLANSLDRQVLPVVTAEISSAGGRQSLSQPFALAAHETRIVQWPVDRSNVVFGGLILANVIQGRYGELDPRQGSCGILVFSLFDLKGTAMLVLISISGIALVLTGGMLWRRLQAGPAERVEQTLKACGGLAGVTTLALLTGLPRWWGLTLFLDAFALIMLSVIFTEFLLFPKYQGS